MVPAHSSPGRARPVVCTVLAAFVVFAGCVAPAADRPTSVPGTTADQSTPAGTSSTPSAADLRVEPVVSAPENATVVPFENETVQGDESLIRAIERADQEDGDVSVHLEGEAFRETAATLDRLPMHESTEFGYYVRTGEETFRVVLAVYE